MSSDTDSQTVTEYVVRVPQNHPKRYNLMVFNAGDRVDFSTWHQAQMERDLSNQKLYGEEEMPEFGAGSEFKRKLREEARRKKYGITRKAFKVEDQPWLLKVNGKTGRRFRGVKKGGVTENTSYYIFTQCPDGAFEAFPVDNWYNFTPLARHRTLTAEEAEEEWERRNKVLNHFSIMQKRRLKGQDREEEEHEQKKKSRKKPRERRVHDLDGDLEMSSEDSSSSEEEGEKLAQSKKKAAPSRGGKKEKGSGEDSDDGDFEGQEVDYMSDSSSSSEDDTVWKPRAAQQEDDGPRGIDEESESSEESEEDKPPEESADQQEEDKKARTAQEKKPRKRDSSDESGTSEESDIDHEAPSALFLSKKTPPKRAEKASGNSSRGDGRPAIASVDSGRASSTPGAAANKLEQGKGQVGASDTPAAKRPRFDAGPQSISGKSPPQPQSGKSTPRSREEQVIEEEVRRYLSRKPMTVKDLLRKMQNKKAQLSSEQMVIVLAQTMKRLNPERRKIKDKTYFSLPE